MELRNCISKIPRLISTPAKRKKLDQEMTDGQQRKCSTVNSSSVVVSYPLLHINGSLYVDKNVQNSQTSYIPSKSRRLEITFDEIRSKQKISESDVASQAKVYQLPLSANFQFDNNAKEATRCAQHCNDNNNQKSDEEQPRQQSMPSQMILCKNLETGHSMKWPILENSSTRVLVPLKMGENIITLQNDQNMLEECVINVIYKPMENKRFVRPVYIVCANSDGKFEAPSGEDNSVESAKQRLAFNARMLQTFTAEHLNLHGFGRKTFRLEEDGNGNVSVHVFQSKLELDRALCMSGGKLYDYFQKELNESKLYDPLCKFWVFMSCTRYVPPSNDQFDEKKVHEYVKGHTALGGGNMALFGTGCLHTWARNLDEFVSRFLDDRTIDRKSLFDDSARRGYYWANYATTLGAAMHELGHTFNLPHTPSGIMGRGFDDMNIFFVGNREPDNSVYAPGSANGIYRDKGAHWHRSSAAVLSCSRWIGDCGDDKTPCEVFAPIMYSAANKRGPLGSGSDGSGKSLKFSSEQWLKEENLDLKGFRIRAEKYINAIQILGTKYEILNAESNASSTEISSQWFGNQEMGGKTYEFLLDSDGERLVSLDIRAGSWLDAVRLHSSHKSSAWIGGKGGALYNLGFGDSDGFDSIFGTAGGDYVTSIGIAREDESEQAVDNEYCHFYSQYGIRVVEVRQQNGEVLKHWEFLDGSPQQNVSILMTDLFLGNAETVAVYDGNGECADFNIAHFKSTLEASS